MKTQFYLTVNNKGAVKTTKTRPDVAWNEVAVQVSLQLPDDIFKKPQLQATITIPDSAVGQPVVQTDVVDNIKEAIIQSTGVEVKLTIQQSDIS